MRLKPPISKKKNIRLPHHIFQKSIDLDNIETLAYLKPICFSQNSGPILSLVINEEKNLLASLCDRGTIALYDWNQQKTVKTLKFNSYSIADLKWLNNSNDFVTSSLGREILIWKNYTPEIFKTLEADLVKTLQVSSNNNNHLISGSGKGVFALSDLSTAQEIFKLDCVQLNTKYNSINTIEEISPGSFLIGMKNGHLQLIDTRLQKSIMKSALQVHREGVSFIEMTRSKINFFTNGRDNTIKYFDIRNIASQKKEKFQDYPIWIFGDHISENFHVSPCFLGDEKYIVSGSKDNLLYFYDLETGCLAYFRETNSSFIPGVVNLEKMNQKMFSFCHINNQDSVIHVLEPSGTPAKQSTYEIQPQDVIRMKITDLMSKNSDAFLDLILSDELNMSTSSWEGLIHHFHFSDDPNLVRIGNEILMLFSDFTFNQQAEIDALEAKLKEKITRLKKRKCKKCHRNRLGEKQINIPDTEFNRLSSILFP